LLSLSSLLVLATRPGQERSPPAPCVQGPQDHGQEPGRVEEVGVGAGAGGVDLPGSTRLQGRGRNRRLSGGAAMAGESVFVGTDHADQVLYELTNSINTLRCMEGYTHYTRHTDSETSAQRRYPVLHTSTSTCTLFLFTTTS
jgi:hypothetical protein